MHHMTRSSMRSVLTIERLTSELTSGFHFLSVDSDRKCFSLPASRRCSGLIYFCALKLPFHAQVFCGRGQEADLHLGR